MLSTRSKFLGVTAVLAVLLATQVMAATAKVTNVLEWDTMVGVPAGLTGAQSNAPLRGINGGGIAWTLDSAKGNLTTGGHLKVIVKGLVLAAGANAGMNPLPAFKGLVSCVNADGTFSNVPTGEFPATIGPATNGGGNSEIETDIALPNPCIAPIVFVTSTGGSWFAATGR